VSGSIVQMPPRDDVHCSILLSQYVKSARPTPPTRQKLPL
jgi:hypothetical protein